MTGEGQQGRHDGATSGGNKRQQATARLEDAVRRFRGPLVRYVRHLLPNRPDQGQDVVQTTFLKFRKALLNGSPVREDAAWLYRVAHNLAIDLNRREDRHCELNDNMVQDAPAATPDPDPTETLGREEDSRIAMGELQQLCDEDRRILILKLFENMTLQEISDMTGVGISTIHYRLNRGIRTLNARFRELGLV